MSYLGLIWEGLHDFTLQILIAASIVSIALGLGFEGSDGWHEGVAILVAVVIVLNVGAYNDMQKDKEFRKLEEANARRNVLVTRGGVAKEVLVDDIKVGDIVRMADGDMAPADGLLLSGKDVVMSEAALTGESDDMKKSAQSDPFIISGTTQTSGEMSMVVVGVGLNSVQGRLMQAILQGGADEARPSEAAGGAEESKGEEEGSESGKAKGPQLKDPRERSKTPLEEKLEVLAQQISFLGLGVGILVFCVMFIVHMVEWSNGEGTVNDAGEREWSSSNYSTILGYFIIAITILVVAIPEGLPLAVTISLAYSVGRMQEENILVRTLAACETMGNATAICTDKTGTLTQNRMRVMNMWNPRSDGAHNFHMPFDNTGTLEEVAAFHDATKQSLSARALELAVANAALNSNADIVPDEDADGNAIMENGKPKTKVSGSKTEGALLYWAQEMRHEGIIKELRDARDAQGLELHKFPFSSKRKRASVVLKDGDKCVLHVKGAPEMLLRLCTHYLDEAGVRRELDGHFEMSSSGEVEGAGAKADICRSVINALSDQALRTIAIAYRELDEAALSRARETVEYAPEELKGFGPCPALEDELTLYGIFGIMDPVRPEVPEAVRTCQRAGVTVRMVTGDNINTARAIGRICNIFREEEGGSSVEGPDFTVRIKRNSPFYEPGYFDAHAPKLQVMARSSPHDKLELVRGLMERGDVVAVTGDGSNDAPALKKSNVGFAMGIAGTEVAKQAADIVLLDDNFKSIVAAVKWGRNVYDSIRKFLQFQLTVNLVALVVAFIGAVSLKESPLTATQLLWVNLIMDSFASLALATEPPTPELLMRKPYAKTASLINKFMLRSILGQFLYQCGVLGTILFAGEDIFEIPNGRGRGHGASPTHHYTLVFHTFVMLQVFNEISSRKVNGEWNILDGIMRNWLFHVIIWGTLVVQYVLVETAGDFMSVKPLTFAEHGAAILFGIGGIGVTFLLHLVPADLMPSLDKPEETGQTMDEDPLIGKDSEASKE